MNVSAIAWFLMKCCRASAASTFTGNSFSRVRQLKICGGGAGAGAGRGGAGRRRRNILIEVDASTDGWMDRQTDRWMGGWVEGKEQTSQKQRMDKKEKQGWGRKPQLKKQQQMNGIQFR